MRRVQLWPAPVRVDETDVRIAHEVIGGTARTLHGRRERVEAVAKKVGLHRNTVRRRLAQMERRLFFFPLRGLVNPTPLGGMFARAFFPLAFDEQTAELETELFESIEGLWCVLRMSDGWDLMVAAVDGREAERAYAKAARIIGTTDYRWLIRTDRDWAPMKRVELDPLDVSILNAVVERGLTPFGRLATELGVSKRTVERHYSALSAADVVRLWPVGGAPPAGISMAYLHVELDADLNKTREVRQTLLGLPNQFLMDVRARKAWAYLYAASATSLFQTATEIKTMPGVRLAFTQMYHGMTTSPRFEELNRGFLDRFSQVAPRAP